MTDESRFNKLLYDMQNGIGRPIMGLTQNERDLMRLTWNAALSEQASKPVAAYLVSGGESKKDGKPAMGLFMANDAGYINNYLEAFHGAEAIPLCRCDAPAPEPMSDERIFQIAEECGANTSAKHMTFAGDTGVAMTRDELIATVRAILAHGKRGGE